eukprot:5764846-Alexandrium_andersonii.AAC.1
MGRGGDEPRDRELLRPQEVQEGPSRVPPGVQRPAHALLAVADPGQADGIVALLQPRHLPGEDRL